MNNYHICEIGRSKNSVVYKGRVKKTIEYLAIKSCEKVHKAKVMNEVRILENLSHENIVKFYAWHKTRNHLWLVLEYCPGGDILTLIDQDKQLPESVIKNFGINIIDGLLYLHSNGIIYADLKPSNILFNEYGVLKLCDFGLARLISDSQNEENKKGTPYYMAPELFEEGGVYSYYSDLWSFGCVLYELAVGTPPFISSTFKDLKEQILNAETPNVPEASAAFNDLISGLLQKDPSKRIGWEEVLWHEFWEGKRLIKVDLPVQDSYEEYLKNRGVVQRVNGRVADNKKYLVKESIKPNLNGKEDFVIKSRDQVFNFGENWESEEREEAKIVHQRSNSAVLQTPALKNQFKPQPIEQLLIHNSDLNIKPIINSYEDFSGSIDISISKWSADNISEHVNSPQLESHLSEVYSILSSNSGVSSKLSYLVYLESLILDYPLANKLINSAFIQLFLQMFNSKSEELKCRICSIVGQMLRHATIIDSDLPKSNISQVLLGIIKEESNATVKRKALSALGEYLFYAATQMDEEEYDEAWKIEIGMVKMLNNEILNGTDEVSKLYAVRTVENITAQSKNGGIIFANTELACSLGNLFMSTNIEELKNSAIAALSHIVSLNTNVFKDLNSVVPPKYIYQGIKEGDEKNQQVLITIVCFALQSRDLYDVSLSVLMGLLESPGIVIRGKALLSFMFLLKTSANFLQELVKTKFFSILDKLLKDNYTYVQCCLHHLLDTVTEKIMLILKSALDNTFALLSVLPPILNSISGRLKLPFPSFIKCISALLLKDNPETNQITIEILETLATKSKQLKSYADLIITHLFPNLLETLNRNIDTRFRCLKIFSDISLQFLYDDEIYDPKNGLKISTKLMNEVLVKMLIPLFNDLLVDSEPVPLYCIKLLSYILDRCPQYVAVIKSHGLINELLFHFEPGHQKLSMHLLQVIKRFIDSGEISVDELIELGFIDKINVVIKYVVEQDWCVEVTLDIFYELLLALTARYREKIHPVIYPLADNMIICTDLLQSEDDAISEKSAHCLLLILQLFGTYLTLNSSFSQGEAMLKILNYNKSGLQKICIKILRGVVEYLNIPGINEKILVLRRHENEEIARIAVEIQSVIRSKSKN